MPVLPHRRALTARRSFRPSRFEVLLARRGADAAQLNVIAAAKAYLDIGVTIRFTCPTATANQLCITMSFAEFAFFTV